MRLEASSSSDHEISLFFVGSFCLPGSGSSWATLHPDTKNEERYARLGMPLNPYQIVRNSIFYVDHCSSGYSLGQRCGSGRTDIIYPDPTFLTEKSVPGIFSRFILLKWSDKFYFKRLKIIRKSIT